MRNKISFFIILWKNTPQYFKNFSKEPSRDKIRNTTYILTRKASYAPRIDCETLLNTKRIMKHLNYVNACL